MGSSLTIFNDTPAPVWVSVTASMDVLMWSLMGLLVVATAATAGAAAVLAAPAAAAGAAVWVTVAATTFKGASILSAMMLGTTSLTYAASKGSGALDLTLKNCLDASLELQKDLEGWTRLDPGSSYRFDGSLSLIQTGWLVDNSGVGWQKKVWTAPTWGGNHRYNIRSHFGGVNANGVEVGLSEACGDNAKVCKWAQYPGLTYSPGYPNNRKQAFNNLRAAQRACLSEPKCKAVTLQSGEYTLRAGEGKRVKYSVNRERTWSFDLSCSRGDMLSEMNAECRAWGCTCQGISDRAGTIHGVSWGSATQQEVDWWLANSCNTTPSNPRVGCQGISDHFGTNHGVTWGSATGSAQQWWLRNNCNTRPAGRRRVEELEMRYPESPKLLRRAGNFTTDLTKVIPTFMASMGSGDFRRSAPLVPDVSDDDAATRLLTWMDESVKEDSNGWIQWESFRLGTQTFEQTCISLSGLVESRKDCIKCVPCLQDAESCPTECFACLDAGPAEPCLMVNSGCATAEEAGHLVKCLGRLDDEDCSNEEEAAMIDESLTCYHEKGTAAHEAPKPEDA